MLIPRENLEDLIFGNESCRRFTQDSPVLPDVWIEYGSRATGPVDLLLTPHREMSPADLSRGIRARMAREKPRPGAGGGPRMAYNESSVVGAFLFAEFVRVVMPLSGWWTSHVDGHRLTPAGMKGERLQRVLLDLEQFCKGGPTSSLLEDAIWMLRIVGAIHWAHRQKGEKTEYVSVLPSGQAMLESALKLLAGSPPLLREHKGLLWSVNRNRPASTAIWRSVEAIKADAATRLFNLSCGALTWAILDSGIDARHPAFRRRGADKKPLRGAFVKKEGGIWVNQTRVLESYDFTRIRALLDPDGRTKLPVKGRLRIDADELRRRLQEGRAIDWSVLGPLLRIPHDASYRPPEHDHGTHVAGILAADWRGGEEGLKDEHAYVGVCPDITLYDLRVLDKDGQGDEFSLLAAIQFLRHLNAHKDRTIVHGANISIAIRHDVVNYACGRTPVCEEAERLVDSGVVVVAAAGNDGYIQYLNLRGRYEEGYRSISITDPGNAEGVITVGATHRYRPHTYGVSYFSSRGPTGDGRLKPDLVAPGEKIKAPVPDSGAKTKDGTSMAAPHVSGAAALLMARHRELLGDPYRVKDVLCKTATDLGRERYFQGHGMVDILRALQSI